MPPPREGQLDTWKVPCSRWGPARWQEILDAELNGYKTNMIKESIRMGHNDLGGALYLSRPPLL